MSVPRGTLGEGRVEEFILEDEKGKGWTGCLFLFQVTPVRKPHWAETKGRMGRTRAEAQRGNGSGGRIRWSCFQLPPWSVIRGIHHNRMDQGMDSTHLCGQVANATAPSAGGFRFRMVGQRIGVMIPGDHRRASLRHVSAH